MRLGRLSVEKIRPGTVVAGYAYPLAGDHLWAIAPQVVEKVTVARRRGEVAGHSLYFAEKTFNGKRKYTPAFIPLGADALEVLEPI